MLPPFGWQAVLERWEFAPVVTAIVAVFAALYLWGAWRVGRRHPARPWPWWRTGLFLGGLAVVVLATESGIGAYDDVLFWDHMIQHLMLIMIAPPLLVLGQPVTLLLHASRNPVHTWAKRVVRSRVATFLTCPPVVLILYAATIAGTHLTGLMSLVMTNPALHNAEHALYLVVGYLFFLPILGSEPIRWRLSYPIRFVILVVAMPVDTFTGLVLGTENTPVKGITTAVRPPGSLTPVADLHAGRRGHVDRRRRHHARLHDAGLPDVGPRRPGRHGQPGLAGNRAHGQFREPRRPPARLRRPPGRRIRPPAAARPCRPRRPPSRSRPSRERAAPSTTTSTWPPTTPTSPG